jgi:tyrosinase-like protein
MSVAEKSSTEERWHMLSRREILKVLSMSTASAVFFHDIAVGRAATLPLPRMPLEEFVQDAALLAALRKGVRAMKARKPSDPLSWFYQAATHGVTDDAIKKAAAQDSNVDSVFKKRYWNQCPHDGENSANFLPWHRAYTYHFENILRMHTEDDRFSLPYWNYTEKANRKFPREFGIKHLDGNLGNDSDANINPLYLAERDFYFTGYEHPFATGLPLVELTDGAVDISLPMGSPVFFGATEREGLGGGIADEDPSTRGLLESYPHDQIHRAVGGIIDSSSGEPTVGAMATPPTAAFDPIFPIHHSNIDRLWAVWSCMAGKTWGKLPSDYWFNERPWFFYDVDGEVVNEPRKFYFDYRKLGIRFKYEDPRCVPLALPQAKVLATEVLRQETLESVQLMVETAVSVSVLSAGRAVVPIAPAMKEHFQNRLSTMSALNTERAAGPVPRLLLRLRSVDLGTVEGTGYDLYLTAEPDRDHRRSEASFIGSIALFRHSHTTASMDGQVRSETSTMDETFDVSKATAAVGNAGIQNLSLVTVPYALLTATGKEGTLLNRDSLKVQGLQLLTTR